MWHTNQQSNSECQHRHACKQVGGLWVVGASTGIDDGVGVNVVGERRVRVCPDVIFLLEYSKIKL